MLPIKTKTRELAFNPVFLGKMITGKMAVEKKMHQLRKPRRSIFRKACLPGWASASLWVDEFLEHPMPG